MQNSLSDQHLLTLNSLLFFSCSPDSFLQKKYAIFRAGSFEGMMIAASLQWNHDDDVDFMKEV